MPFTTSEATLLLRKLEEVISRSSYGAGKDYLAVLAQCTKNGDEKFALQQLQGVRLALAKYYARCAVMNVGGKTTVAGMLNM